jgi:hypothetical protein
MIAPAHYLKSHWGASVHPAPFSWPMNGPKRLGIQQSNDFGKPPCQWLRQTDLKPAAICIIAVSFESINEICL